MAESMFCRECGEKMIYHPIGLPHYECSPCDVITIMDGRDRLWLKKSDPATKIKCMDLMQVGKNINFPRR